MIVALMTVGIQYAWPRRSVTTVIPSPYIDVAEIEHFLERAANRNDAITAVQIDVPTNSVRVTAQARHLETAAKDIAGRLGFDPGMSNYSALELDAEQIEQLLAE